MFCLKSPGISAYLYSKFVCIFAIEKRSTGCEGVPFTIRAIVADFEELSHAGKSSTRTSVKDEHLKMEFVDGDSIGVFAIKDGAIMDDIDNAKLVYNRSSGSWNPVGNGTLYWYDGVSYVAYYPYRRNITIDVSKGMDGAIASLTGNEELQPSKDQSTTEKHIVSDLLIATGVPAIDNSSVFILGAPLLGLAHSGFWLSVGIVGAGWGGAVMVLLLIAIISRYVKNILGVLIMGVMIGYIAGAIIQILQYLSSAEQLKMFFLWSMGSLGHVTTTKLFIMIPVICVGVILSIYCIKALNLLLLGENYAQTMGLNIRRARTLIFVSTTLLTGTVTAFCGPVGFLGLAVPHVARMLFNDADHRTLLPGSILLGVVAMLLCDIIAKTLVLPVNCITALLGIPVIIWVVYKNLRPA